MYNAYRILITAISPLAPLILKHRLKHGKEDAAHIKERRGIASLARPKGKLLWLHAASVGESNSVLPLIETLLSANSELHILLTTVTVTSANMMRARLPGRAFHQYAPLDIPGMVNNFLDHWRPDVALWVDSELWPTIIMETRKRGTYMGIVNARMSEKSFFTWNFALPLISKLLSCFSFCYAQSTQDADRLLQLGLPSITGIGNLKYDAPPLPFKEEELVALEQAIGKRPLWVAASTHPGEEEIIIRVHQALVAQEIPLLTIIVPRHARRGDEIRQLTGSLPVAQRSKKEAIQADTGIYIADTMGELGLLYRLSSIAFIGGSLVPHGGQNPLEAARVGSAVIIGPYHKNFAEIIAAMEHDRAIITITGEKELFSILRQLFFDEQAVKQFSQAAIVHAASKTGTIDKIMNELRQHLT